MVGSNSTFLGRPRIKRYDLKIEWPDLTTFSVRPGRVQSTMAFVSLRFLLPSGNRVNAYGGKTKEMETSLLEDIRDIQRGCYNLMNDKNIEKVGIEIEEKEYEHDKSDSAKENECFIETKESIKEEQKEKEVVILDKSEIMALPLGPRWPAGDSA
ncbi:hypothetical protein M9H77_08888 [Catharanthus roseus]|uniref:Uncharacterized protein n=1 Tax=Catharanthus roseus TaxID=4058 RepID=A0ACC0BZG9_CATRO|nr:hypothetical protein M9H77_08888 [Catharanthus roseus]